jgi:hypothetical protein
MSTENQTEEVQAAVTETESGDTITESTNQTEQTISIEDRAREQGWRPKEEFSGDVSKWVSAETFVAKGELIEKIESLGKKLKDSEKTMNMLKEHYSKVKDTEFKNAVAFLKAQKKEAYEQGDVDKIIELDDKIAEFRDTQKRQKEVEASETQPDVHPDFAAWVSDNSWYDKDSEMRGDADAIGASYKKNNPSKTAAEVLEHVTNRVKKLYPEKFQNQNRNRPSAVEGSGTRSGSSRDNFSLTDEETKVMQTFIRNGIIGTNGVMTKEDYIKQVKETRGN